MFQLLNVLLGAGAELHHRHGSQRLASPNDATREGAVEARKYHGPRGCCDMQPSEAGKHVLSCNLGANGSEWKQMEANAMEHKISQNARAARTCKNTLCDFSVPTLRVPDLGKRSRCDSNSMFLRESASYSSKLMRKYAQCNCFYGSSASCQWAFGAPRSVQL